MLRNSTCKNERTIAWISYSLKTIHYSSEQNCNHAFKCIYCLLIFLCTNVMPTFLTSFSPQCFPRLSIVVCMSASEAVPLATVSRSFCAMQYFAGGLLETDDFEMISRSVDFLLVSETKTIYMYMHVNFS